MMGVRYCCPTCGMAFPANQMTSYGPAACICQRCALNQQMTQTHQYFQTVYSENQEKDITDLVEIVTVIEAHND